MVDVLVIGAGPAGLAIAAALCNCGLHVQGLAPDPPDTAWRNTYGIWRDELEPLGLADLLGHCWQDCSAYADGQELPLRRSYGLFDNAKLQGHLLTQCEQGQMRWQIGLARAVEHWPTHSVVTAQRGEALAARLVIDASGHAPALVRRPAAPPPAYQAAYGIVGRFSTPPVRPGQLVLMDYRSEHLTPAEHAQPSTFLYAMDLGEDLYFVEETSLAFRPAVSLEVLAQRLQRRLAHRGVQVTATHHVERCLFPMNLPLPDRSQRVLGYGGAASMVHPASGYQVGAALKRAAAVAQAIAHALAAPNGSPQAAARQAWQTLWPADLVRKRQLYLLGLESVLRFNQRELQSFFAAFFRLPVPQWSGYLSDTLSTDELVRAMMTLFGRAPNHVRLALARAITGNGHFLWDAVKGR